MPKSRPPLSRRRKTNRLSFKSRRSWATRKLYELERDMVNCSEKFLTEFFETYKRHECLWKIKAPGYLDKTKRKLAYEALLAKYREREPEATEDYVKKKINNYRTCYKRELKLVQKSLKNGGENGNFYKPRLWYFEHLKFLEDQDTSDVSSNKQEVQDVEVEEMDVKERFSPVDELKIESTEFFDDGYYTFPSTSTTQKMTLPVNTTEYNNIDVQRTVRSGSTQSPCNPPEKQHYGMLGVNVSTPEVRVPVNTVQPVNVSVVGTVYPVRKRSTQSPCNQSERQKFEVFGEYVAMKLQMVSHNQRILAEKLINDVLFEAELDNLNRECKLVVK